MKMLFQSAALLLTGLAVSACTHTSQFTSGQAYLDKYQHPAYAAKTTIDQDVREIAAIEPRLEFPARIGLARIQSGTLTSIPADEVAAWQSLAEDLGAAYGEFVPVSPLVAAMVAEPLVEGVSPAKRVVDEVRRGSARQHLDYVLIYEINHMSDKTSNTLRVTDLSILGLYVMPSRKVKVDATASAILIDVRNGYPYGTATAFAEEARSVTVAGARSTKSKIMDRSRLQAVENLTHDVYAIFEDLGQLEQARNMAESAHSAPIVSGIGTDRH